MHENTVVNQMNAANQILARLMRPSKLNRNQFQSIRKTPGVAICRRLGYAPADGPARRRTYSCSRSWSQFGAASGPRLSGASGSGPYRLGPLVPLRQNISANPQRLRATRTNIRTSAGYESPSQSLTLPSRMGAVKNGTIHQPLLLRSRSRLTAVAVGKRIAKTKNGVAPA